VRSHKDYQNDDFYPGDEWDVDLDWMDEPLDINENTPLEWVSTRKKTLSENGQMVWGDFTEPKL
jgi:hypothetical protein